MKRLNDVPCLISDDDRLKVGGEYDRFVLHEGNGNAFIRAYASYGGDAFFIRCDNSIALDLVRRRLVWLETEDGVRVATVGDLRRFQAEELDRRYAE
jgi:hypothetical protein